MLGSPRGRARRSPCHLAPAAHGVRAARYLLLSGARLPGHIDALSTTVAVMLNLVNSSSRDFQQWNIIVCHMSVQNWLTGQTGCWDPWFLLSLCPLKSVTMCFACHRPRLWVSIFVSQLLIFSWDFPSDPVILSSTSINSFAPKCILACMRLSLSGGCIMPKLPVNVFLITCFYWKPQFPVLPPHLWVWPDWAPTSVHRAKRHPRPPCRSIITTPARVYGQPLSR